MQALSECELGDKRLRLKVWLASDHLSFPLLHEASLQCFLLLAIAQVFRGFGSFLPVAGTAKLVCLDLWLKAEQCEVFTTVAKRGDDLAESIK